jgi:hypothetical protein
MIRLTFFTIITALLLHQNHAESSSPTAKPQVLIVKVVSGGKELFAAVPFASSTKLRTIYLTHKHFKHNLSLWEKFLSLLKIKDHCQYCPTQTTQEEQVANAPIIHVCCSSLLHGTCPHQALIALDPTLQYQQAYFVPADILDELEITAVEQEDLAEYAEVQEELKRFEYLGSDVPAALLIKTEPPSKFTVMMRRVGVACLLQYIAVRSYVTGGWKRFKSLFW